MKNIFIFITKLWNKFINLFTKKFMTLQIDITTDINTYIKNNSQNLIYINNPSYSLLISHIQSPSNTHQQKVVINFSLSNIQHIETVINFDKIQNVHIVEISEGNSNLNGMGISVRQAIYNELDTLNNTLKNTHYINRYKFYHP